MSVELSQLEQAWLAAETMADEVKQQALRLSAELAKCRQLRGEQGQEVQDVTVLISTVEMLKAKQQEADRTASAAFDRFWTAKSNGSGKAAPASSSAYA